MTSFDAKLAQDMATESMTDSGSYAPEKKDDSPFKFITATKPTHWRTNQARLLVRAHAARRQHWNRRWPGRAEAKTTGSLSANGGADKSQEDDSVKASAAQQKHPDPSFGALTATEKAHSTGAMAFRAILLQDSDNVVGKSVVQLGTDVQTLFDRFLGIIDEHSAHFWSFPAAIIAQDVTLRGKLWPFIFTNAALMSAALLLAGSYIARLHGENPSKSRALLYMRGFAIQKIQEGIREGLSHVLIDQLILAATLLCKYEALYGRRENHAAHMRGLVTLVQARGGLGELGLGGVIERLVLWFDVLTAQLLGTEPLYDLSMATLGPLTFSAVLMRNQCLNETERPERC